VALGPLTTVAALVVCSAAGGLRGGSTPYVAADRFTSLVLTQDTRLLCGSITPRLLVELGGRGGCARRFGPDRAEVDRVAKRWLTDTWRSAAAALQDETRGPGYPPARKLLRAMRASSGATLRLARGPGAVRGRAPSFVVLDVRALRAGRFVLYAESDTGTIFRLVAQPLESPVVEPTSVAGIPDLTLDGAERIPRTIAIAGATPVAARAVATLDLHEFVQTMTLSLVNAGGEWLVDRVEIEVRWQPE
jgi:hypothetical protein